MVGVEHAFCNIYVGAETGLFKGVNVDKGCWRNINRVENAVREHGINVMCWGDRHQQQVCLGLRDKTVQVYSTDTGQLTEERSLDSAGDGVFTGLYRHDDCFLTCTQSGLVKLWREDGTQLEQHAGANVHRMRQNCEQSHLVATGGKENDLKIWDLEKSAEPIFKAKNVKNDWLSLRVPVAVLDMAFVPHSNKVITCTAHHQVRVYDPSTSQRRPVLDMQFDEYPLTAMALRPGDNQVLVGNTHGKMALLDLRGKGHMVNCYRGFGGGIECIGCHPSLPLVASCGLDRFLIIHDIDSKMLHSKFYLKSRLRCLLFADQWLHELDKHSSGEPPPISDEIVEDTSMMTVKDEEEDEKIWMDMTIIGTEEEEEGKKRRRKEDGEKGKGNKGKRKKLENADVTTAKKKKHRKKISGTK